MKNGIIIFASFIIVSQPLSAQRQLFDFGHLDINWTYSGGEWSAEYFDSDNSPVTRLPVSDGVMVATNGLWLENAGSLIAGRPAVSSWDIVGVDAGEPIWFFPFDRDGANVLEPGFATYGVPLGDPDVVRINLVGMDFIGEGEGHFTLYTNMDLIHMATSNGIDGQDFYQLGRGDHRHVNWVFSQRGVYLISLTASAQSGAELVTSEPQTLMVAVGLWPMELWLIEKGVDPTQLGENDTPAGDGIGNLLKYALGLHPLEPITRSLVEPSYYEDGGDEYLALDLSLNPQAEDITVRVETSGDLVDWHSGSGHTVTLEQATGRVHVRDALAVGEAERRFIRMAVERNLPGNDD